MSTFGTLFRVTTYGESHCKGVGAVVDGCPPLLELTEDDIQPQLTRRRPGQSRLTTPRSETDTVTIMSGTEHGKTLGTPIALFVPNRNVRPQDYKEMSNVPRPGHADYTYQMKYGVRASSGGGRSSARETIGRVAGGAIAEKWLSQEYGTSVVAFVSSIGAIELDSSKLRSPSGAPWTRAEVDSLGKLVILRNSPDWLALAADPPTDGMPASAQAADDQWFVDQVNAGTTNFPAYLHEDTGTVYDADGNPLSGIASPLPGMTDELVTVRCPCPATSSKMATLVRLTKSRKDSIGGVLTCVCTGVPVGLGEPCFDKLEAKLAHAMLSLPATKGFEIGSGFAGTRVPGSKHNDPFLPADDSAAGAGGGASGGASGVPLRLGSNNAGGTLGGISSGQDIYFRVAIKSVSTIGQAQTTATYDGKATVLEAKGRHDPCVLPRASPLVEGMAALVLADAALIQRSRFPLVTLPAKLQAALAGDSKTATEAIAEDGSNGVEADSKSGCDRPEPEVEGASKRARH